LQFLNPGHIHGKSIGKKFFGGYLHFFSVPQVQCVVVTGQHHSFGAPREFVTEGVVVRTFGRRQCPADAVKFLYSSTKAVHGVDNALSRHVVDSGVEPALVKYKDSGFFGLFV
jgi:hypothetical protein